MTNNQSQSQERREAPERLEEIRQQQARHSALFDSHDSYKIVDRGEIRKMLNAIDDLLSLLQQPVSSERCGEPCNLPFDDYCAGRDCRTCTGLNCTCVCHVPRAATDTGEGEQREAYSNRDLKDRWKSLPHWSEPPHEAGAFNRLLEPLAHALASVTSDTNPSISVPADYSTRVWTEFWDAERQLLAVESKVATPPAPSAAGETTCSCTDHDPEVCLEGEVDEGRRYCHCNCHKPSANTTINPPSPDLPISKELHEATRGFWPEPGEVGRLRTELEAAQNEISTGFDVIFPYVVEADDADGAPLSLADKIQILGTTNDALYAQLADARANAIREAVGKIRPILVAHYNDYTNSTRGQQLHHAVNTTLQSLLDKQP